MLRRARSLVQHNLGRDCRLNRQFRAGAGGSCPLLLRRHHDVTSRLAIGSSERNITLIQRLTFSTNGDRSTVFLDRMRDKPSLIHVPNMFLYTSICARAGAINERAGGVNNLNGTYSYELETFEEKMHTWYTATWIDPLTGEKFQSGLGRRLDAERIERMKSASLKIPLYEADVRVRDGRVYYYDERLAKNAAAARAIDCYMFREEQQGEHEQERIQLCYENPYNTASATDGIEIHYNSLLDQTRGGHENSSSHRFSNLARNKPFQLHVPIQFLDVA